MGTEVLNLGRSCKKIDGVAKIMTERKREERSKKIGTELQKEYGVSKRRTVWQKRNEVQGIGMEFRKWGQRC